MLWAYSMTTESTLNLKEMHKYATGDYCRNLFVMLITENALSDPAHVWEQTCDELSEDIENLRRRELNIPSKYIPIEN